VGPDYPRSGPEPIGGGELALSRSLSSSPTFYAWLLVCVGSAAVGAQRAQEFKQGDEVEWSIPQGKTRGTVKKKLTSRTEVGGQTVAHLRGRPRTRNSAPPLH